jgi:hypothetical protein
MTTPTIGLLHEIDVHVLYPNDRQDCTRVIAETRAEAVQLAQHELNCPDGCMFMALFANGTTNLASA